MITYKLSRREKFLLYTLAIILVIIAWFVLVFQNTTNQVASLEAEISTANSTIEIDTARVAQMAAMQQVIEQRKSEGARITEVPDYDNMKPLMTELNSIMAAAETYTLTFDDLDRESSSEYVYRGVRINFSCGSYGTAESIIVALANGTYPCVIDSVAIVDNNARSSSTTGTASATSVSGYAHVTFFEKYPVGGAAAISDDAAAAAETVSGGASASSSASAATA